MGVGSLKRRLATTSRRGLTLIEAAMVLAILALVVAGIMLFYTQANTSRQTTAALGELAAVQQAVRGLYGGQSSYTGITNAALVNTDAMPQRMIATGGTLRHSFNGLVNVTAGDAGAGAGSGFQVEFTNVPSDACSRMLTSDLGRGLFSVSAGGQTRSQAATPPPFDPAGAGAACSSNSNTIRWIFN